MNDDLTPQRVLDRILGRLLSGAMPSKLPSLRRRHGDPVGARLGYRPPAGARLVLHDRDPEFSRDRRERNCARLATQQRGRMAHGRVRR